MTQRNNYDAIVAWASGLPIQERTGRGWVTYTSDATPDFANPTKEFRPKPEIIERTVYLQAEGEPEDTIYDTPSYNIRATFNSATGALIDAVAAAPAPNA